MRELEAVVVVALLHDIGKFSQRVGNELRWRHEAFTEQFLRAFSERLGADAERILDLAATHHQEVTQRDQLCVKLADWLASAERRREVQPQIAPERTALLALPSRVQLTQPEPQPRFFPLHPLRLDEATFFPTKQRQVAPDDYRDLWNEFTKTLEQLPSPLTLTTWLTLLQVYTHAIPSATPWEREPERRTTPDVSLFHHAKLTAAIAACLAHLPEDQLSTDELVQLRNALREFEAPDFLFRLCQNPVAQKPLCLLVRGDVAGIQSWLYRIARAEGETHRRTAKRLRGRSFYLVLLTEAVALWLCQQAGVPTCNILFCGGGVFDVLFPVTVEPKLTEWERTLDEWLLNEFFGDLKINLAWVRIGAHNFYQFGSVYQRLAAALEQRKRQTFAHHLDALNFWQHEAADICRYCDTKPFAQPDAPCEQCQLHERLGDALRHTDKINYLVWASGNAASTVRNTVRTHEGVSVRFDPLGLTAALVDEQTAQAIVKAWDGQGNLTIRKRNDPQNWWQALLWDKQKPVSAGVWWVASDTPVALRQWQAPNKPGDDPDAIVHAGEGMDFDEIAALSDGDDLLGVLRMDVDNLGALFAVGVEPSMPSRLAELSGRMDAFFSGWLLQRCHLLTAEWQNDLSAEDLRWGLVKNAFYLVYAGGDDLMVIGPWNLTLQLAWHIYNDFRRYSGNNPNLTISAGIVFVKPKFPIHRFALMAGEALEQAKGAGRNRITAFQTAVAWQHYKDALDFGVALAQATREGKIPRSFLHFLLRLYRTYLNGRDPLWLPLLHYMVARRLKPEIIAELRLLEQVPTLANQQALPIALGFAILATRERRGTLTRAQGR